MFEFLPFGQVTLSFGCPGHFPACPGFQTPKTPKGSHSVACWNAINPSDFFAVYLVLNTLMFMYLPAAVYFMNYALIILVFILKPLNHVFNCRSLEGRVRHLEN